MNTIVKAKAKGKRIERKAVERLSKLDFRVEKPVEKKYGRTDFWGLFDIIAIRNDEIKFIQVKANRASGIRETGKKAREFMDIEKFDIEFWIFHDREGWRIKQLRKDGWKTLLDERE